MHYTLLGNSGLRVSEICFGTMTFGKEWGWGADDTESSKMFDAYLEAGGNFLDTANRYTEGSSEKILGRLIHQSGKRDDLVVATKFSLVTQTGDGINRSGNHRKNIMQSVEGSLQRLGLDCIDLLYLHAWDYTTQMEEVLRALDDLVSQGKILYTGISDTPAWIVARANAIAGLKNWTEFQALQVEYSLLQRTTERELIPMANALGLSLLAWAPIAGGALTGKYLEGNDSTKRLQEASSRLNDENAAIVRKTAELARELGCKPHQLAIRWVMNKGDRHIPIVGAKSAAQLKENLAAISVEIPDAIMQELDKVSAISLGFPHDFLNSEGVTQILFGGVKNRLLQDKKRF